MSAAPTILISPSAADGLVYGPVSHPVSGLTLGLNILGTKAKVCSFDCVYCDLGVTEIRLNKLKESGVLPNVDEILQATQEAFRRIHERGPMVQSICLSGNGEPTIHPDFPEVVSGLIALRNTWLPKKPISLLTNGYNLDQRRIHDAVLKLDERIVKVDAGNERVFKELNKPLSRVTLQKVISGLRLLKDVSIQAMFCQGIVDNTLPADVEDWIEVMALLKPRSVFIQGMSRPSPMKGLLQCDEDTLHTIASKLERRTGLRAVVLP